MSRAGVFGKLAVRVLVQLPWTEIGTVLLRSLWRIAPCKCGRVSEFDHLGRTVRVFPIRFSWSCTTANVEEMVALLV